MPTGTGAATTCALTRTVVAVEPSAAFNRSLFFGKQTLDFSLFLLAIYIFWDFFFDFFSVQRGLTATTSQNRFLLKKFRLFDWWAKNGDKEMFKK
jgi:hypothetical protein